MRRRRLLAAVTGGSFLSGCLSEEANGDETPTETNEPDDTEPSDGTPDRRYEECSREVIPYEQFPAEIQTEIDAALEGRFAADRVFLREAMDTESSYVSVDDEYYDAAVENDGDEEILTLELVRPKALPKPRSISVEHDLDGERTIAVEVVAEDGTVLLDETRTTRPGGRVEFGETTRVGTHDLSVVVADGDRIETEWNGSMRVNESYFETIVIVEPDEVFTTGTVADLGICRYES